MTSSFSASCVRSARTSASSSRVRRLSRFWRSACLPCLHTRGLQPAAQCVDADTKFLGNLCARTALFCHHPDRSGLERLVVPGRRYPFFAFVFHFLCPLSIITNAFLSINSGKGAKEDLLEGMNEWPDNLPGAWYYLAVQEATNSHAYERKGEVYERRIMLDANPDWTDY